MPPFDDRRQALLATAARVFAEKGYHASSMRDLARASGMSLSGMYHYVDRKDDLLFQIQDQCFAEVLAGASAAVADRTDPVDRLGAFIRHHVLFFTANMDEMRVLSHEDEELSGTMAARIRQRKRAYVELLHRLLEEIPGQTVDPHLAGYALFGAMNWLYTWYHPDGAVAPAELADQLTNLFLRGFAPTAAHAAAPAAATHGG